MADTTNRVAGTAYFTVDGTAYEIVGEFEYNASTVTRETLTGQDGVHGYKEKPMAPHISGSLRDSGGLTVADFNDMTNVTLSLQLANGKMVIGRNMWTVEDQTVKTEESTFEVRWEGRQGAVTEN